MGTNFSEPYDAIRSPFGSIVTVFPLSPAKTGTASMSWLVSIRSSVASRKYFEGVLLLDVSSKKALSTLKMRARFSLTHEARSDGGVWGCEGFVMAARGSETVVFGVGALRTSPVT